MTRILITPSDITGMELGFATVRRVLAGCNCRAVARSRLHTGSAFTVTFPWES